MKKLSLILFVALIFFSCKKESTVNSITSLATVITDSVTAITSSTATSWATVTDDGGDPVTERGVCWNTSANPDITGSHSSDGSGTGSFTSTITGLNPSTVYYIRAYATNNAGTAYGNEITINSQTDVYVVGQQYSPTMRTIATVWKNGVATLLTDGAHDAAALAGCASGTDVYIVGHESIAFNPIATVWKNGVPAHLSDPAIQAMATSIFVSGTDVYVAGFEETATTIKAMLWKNGVATILSNNGQARSVYVAGTDVYVVGYEGSSSGAGGGRVWKNGISIPYTTDNFDPYSVLVSGPDVYVTGKKYVGNTPFAAIWKNGVGTSLSNGSGHATAKSIFVSGNDVYVAGDEEFSANQPIGTIWKNGVTTHLTVPGANGYAEKVCVVGSDVYVAGYDFNGSVGHESARVYKNGIVTILPKVEVKSFANSMFVR